ncbi:voltage-dependent calcium channel subunit alpha-2/delta-3 [Cricetulus griseus]|nr:voltage-dependent calcium channel subunit alpha-2/delta-3 [Cricetulus griseus]
MKPKTSPFKSSCGLWINSLGITSELEKYKEYEKDVAIEEIDGLQLVKKLAKNMEEMFHKKSEAVRFS